MIKCTTESGSEWYIDEGRKLWFRPVNTDSPYVRTTQGRFYSHTPIEVGSGIVFLGPAITFTALDAGGRITQTTPVERIEEEVPELFATVYHQENTPIMTQALVLAMKPDKILVACIGGDERCRETHWAFPSAVEFDET